MTAAAVPLGRFELRPATRELLDQGCAVALGARAFDVLLALAERRDRLVSKGELLELVWPNVVVEENNLQVQISQLRKVLGSSAIATIPGRGYRLTLVEPSPASGAAGVPTEAPVADSPADDARRGGRTNLPAHEEPLFGRDDDVRLIDERVEQHALVSIVGAGGIGKTRVALAVALGRQSSYPDGTWWVDLAPISDDAMVIEAVAHAVGITHAVEHPLTRLVAVLRDARAMLILDNCEHVLESVAHVTDCVLRACRDVRVLVTSQEPLRVTGENVYRLDGLAVPPPGEPVDPSTASVALFVARARMLDRRLRFDSDALAVVGAICRELDGMPLAIELAAARVPLLGLEGLCARLRERFHVLTGGKRMVMRRHQTLRAAIDWSHGLLDDDERIVFRRLGVFTGGFSLPLAQAVIADDGIDAWSVLELVGHLVDKSLVASDLHDTSAEPRYRLLETTRAYALEKLAAAEETSLLLDRHARALCDMLREVHSVYWSVSQQERARAVAELDNVRAAHEWSQSREGDVALTRTLLAVSRLVWHASGLLLEGLQRCLKAPPASVEPRIEGWLQSTVAQLGYLTARADSFEAAGRAATLFAQLGDPLWQADALLHRVILATRRGDAGAAEAALGDVDRLFRPEWPPRLRGYVALARMLHLLTRDEVEGALAAAWEQVACYREDALAGSELIALTNVAFVETMLGRYDAALERLEQVLARMQQLDRQVLNVGHALANLAQTLAFRNGPGDHSRALAFAAEAWPLLRRQARVAWLLEIVGIIHAHGGNAEAAVRLFAYGDAARAQEGELELPPKGRVIEAVLDGLRARHGDARVRTWRASGAAMSDDEAAALAFETVPGRGGPRTAAP